MSSWVRAVVFALPVLLVAVLVASFVGVKVLPARRQNAMIVGTIGEAKVLNPIIYTTASDAEVLAFIFNGLLKYDENLEVVGDLAQGWELKQTSTIFFVNADEAEKAASRLEQLREQWVEWDLTAATTAGEALQLNLSMPGKNASRAIHALFDRRLIQPLTIVRVEMENSAQDSASHFIAHAAHADQIERVWVDTSRAYELTIAGDLAPVLAELQEYYRANADLKAEARVLEEVPVIDEPEIIFRLRPDVRWHDGVPFTAEDVVFTYRMIMDENVASPRRPDYELIQSVRALTPHQVRVVYRKPYSPALLSWMMGVLPKHILEGKSTDWWAQNFNRAPVGTGPFKFGEWQTNEFIQVIRNTNYYEGAPHLESVIFRTIPDPVAIRLAFETRQIDFWGVDEHAVGSFEEDQRFALYPSPQPAYSYIGWNLRRPLFQDKKVRQALAHAVNVPAMINYLLYGFGEQSTGIFPPQMWFFNDQVQPFTYDPEKAKQLLAEAGWKPGRDGILVKDGRRFSFQLITNQANEIRKDVATLVQADFKKIGIEVDVQIFEWAVFIEQYINKGDFDATVLGWRLGYDYDQYQIWHSSQTDPGELNHVGYKNPRVDQLLEEIRTEYDRETIKQIAAELQQIIYEDQPYLFLYVPKATAAMWKEAYRVRRPEESRWIDEPVRPVKAGYSFYRTWFYKPEYQPAVAP